MKKLAVLALCIVCISNSAIALTAGQLEEDCKLVDAVRDDSQMTTTQMARGLRCLGYVEGFVNSIMINGGKELICIQGAGVLLDRVRRAFLDHMEMLANLREFEKEFPNVGEVGTYLTSEDAWLSFQPALMRAFPCPSE